MKFHTMGACGHGIISADIIPAQTSGSAHLGAKRHAMVVFHGIITSVPIKQAARRVFVYGV